MSSAPPDALPALQSIGLSITVLRGQRVILDSDLAELYGVETKRFNEAVKRNAEKFPLDLMFEMTAQERVCKLEVAICDLKFDSQQARRAALCATGVYRAWRTDGCNDPQ